MEKNVYELLRENDRRLARLHASFDPVTGENSTGERVEADAAPMPEGWTRDGKAKKVWLPKALMEEALVKDLIKWGSVKALARRKKAKIVVTEGRLERLRIKHDFAYWAYRYVMVKRKGGGDDCSLLLSHPQRRLVEALEDMRLAEKPIRLVLLKARQWGGSTVTQMYMAWLQLTHETGLNSLIIAHQSSCTDEIMDMFDRMIRSYPTGLLHVAGEEYKEDEPKIKAVGKSRSIFRVPQRNCKVKVGTAERPNSCRGGDYNLVHLSEVGLWRATLGKKPEDIVRAACSGILYRPGTMIVYESTANGVGNFFHREYTCSRDNAKAQFASIFVPWHEIEHNELPFRTEEEREEFAKGLLTRRGCAEAATDREESGSYLWMLWERGATLEGINWYVAERGKHTSHGSMAAECPTDDIEAFVNSGAAVFDKYCVERMRSTCRKPELTGEVASSDKNPTRELRFVEDAQGGLRIWMSPAADAYEWRNRYLTVVDIGGRSEKADWSVVTVFDREPMLRGEGPEVAAQWRGHIDMDLLAWKAVRIAAYYGNSLLAIESNTLETHDALRDVDGDQSDFILNRVKSVYRNLYARRPSAQSLRDGMPVRYGFHTNVATKNTVVSTLVEAVREGLYTERDERCLDELLTYERRQNGSYGAIAGAHDDMLMTRAIGLFISGSEMHMPSKPGARGRRAETRPLF
ncbi:MAG: hypothetical protein NC102_05655 [Clostridium sp.]|nr:hypothetical protein [Clostridium sp.]